MPCPIVLAGCTILSSSSSSSLPSLLRFSDCPDDDFDWALYLDTQTGSQPSQHWHRARKLASGAKSLTGLLLPGIRYCHYPFTCYLVAASATRCSCS